MIKKIVMILLTLVLLGGSAEAVTFDDAMKRTGGIGGLFPSWEQTQNSPEYPRISGVIGQHNDGENGTEKLLVNYVPHLINVLLKFVAPLVMVAMVYAGIRFVYAGSDEEELSQAKHIFTYTLMGALFVVLSYSIMKALYFILST